MLLGRLRTRKRLLLLRYTKFGRFFYLMGKNYLAARYRHPDAPDRFRGAGEATITLPPMDGAIRPNQAIDAAAVALEIERPDNLVFDGRRVVFSSGATALAFDPSRQMEKPEVIARFDSEVTCLATDAGGNLAVGLNDGAILFAAGPRKG